MESNTEGQSIAESFKASVYEMVVIYLYNLLVLKKDNTEDLFVPPEDIGDRRKITDIVKKKTHRKSVISKPKGSETIPKAVKQVKKKIKEVEREVSVAHKVIPLSFEDTGDDRKKKTIMRILKNHTGLTDAQSEKIIKDPKKSNKFLLYVVPIDSNRSAELCVYKKGKYGYVIGMAIVYPKNEGKKTTYLPLSDIESEEDRDVYKLVRNYTIAIPDVKFSEPQFLRSLYSEFAS